MKFLAGLTAASLLFTITATAPQAASARGKNNNAQLEQIILNNFNTSQTQLSNQISSYLSSGQISQAQASGFTAQLSQIAGQFPQSVNNSAMTQQILGQLSALSNQINGAVAPVGTYLPQTYLPVNGQGVISNWENRLSDEENKLRNDFRNRNNERRQVRLQNDQQGLAQALQTFDQRTADQNQRFNQQMTEENQRFQQRLQEEEQRSANHPNYQNRIQQLYNEHNRAVNDINQRQTARQQAATLERQKIAQDYNQRIQNDQH